MKEEQLFEQWKKWRGMIAGLLEKTSEEEADQVPAPFRNSIRWNAGHLIVGIDGLVANTLGTKKNVPERYVELFATGTSPADWEGEVPTLDELKHELTEQPDHIRIVTAGKLGTKLEEPFLGMNTLGEVLAFMISHDAMHLGTMSAIRKVVRAK